MASKLSSEEIILEYNKKKDREAKFVKQIISAWEDGKFDKDHDGNTWLMRVAMAKNQELFDKMLTYDYPESFYNHENNKKETVFSLLRDMKMDNYLKKLEAKTKKREEKKEIIVSEDPIKNDNKQTDLFDLLLKMSEEELIKHIKDNNINFSEVKNDKTFFLSVCEKGLRELMNRLLLGDFKIEDDKESDEENDSDEENENTGNEESDEDE